MNNLNDNNINEEHPSDTVSENPVYDNDTDALLRDNGKKRNLPIGLKFAALASVGLAVFSVVLRICLSGHPFAGEMFYRYISRYLQAAFGFLTSFLPFSLAETLLLLLPLAIVLVIVSLIRHLIKKDIYRLKRLTICIFTAVCLITANAILNLSILYCRPSLSVLSGIDDSDVTTEELCVASFYTVYKLENLVLNENIKFDNSGASVCPYGFSELDKKIDDAFDKYAERNDWISPYGAKAKIISLSDYMTYTHLSGIYTQFTGEANINVNYPDYVVCSTIAHEKAHQRGIAPENEANLVAFFVLCESGDPYLEYCGYMSVFSDLMRDARNIAPEFYSENIAPAIPYEVRGELTAHSSFFDKYRDSEPSKKADALNNAYIKINGDSNGVLSYNMVSEIATRYIIETVEKELYAE